MTPHSLWTTTMNRCTPGLMAILILMGTASGLLIPRAIAQTEEAIPKVRQFPKTAVRGELIVFEAPEISMSGRIDRLSPGVRIRDANNNLILSSTLTGQRLAVNYTRDNTGLVHQIWVLNGDEIKQKMPGQDGGILSNIRSMFDTPAASDDGKTSYQQLPAYKP